MRTTTKGEAQILPDLEMPPSGGDLTPAGSLEQEANALRVMLDRSENMKVAVGQKLLSLLNNQFDGNRNALRDWYEAEIYEGKSHRSWNTVERYLGVVRMYGDSATAEFARQQEINQAWHREHYRPADVGIETSNINGLRESGSTLTGTLREPKSEYEQRKQWLATMDYYWFKSKPEWRTKWLNERGLREI